MHRGRCGLPNYVFFTSGAKAARSIQVGGFGGTVDLQTAAPLFECILVIMVRLSSRRVGAVVLVV
jgi:hypothetical protein